MNWSTKWTVRSLFTWTFVVIFYPVFTESDSNDPFPGHPKIITQDGHIVFQTAENHNITFRSAGKGSIRINDIDLGKLTERTQSALAEMNQFKASQMLTVSRTVDELKSQMSQVMSTVNQIGNITEKVNQLSQDLRDLVGTGSRKLNGNRLRAEFSKIRRVESRLNEIKQILERNECGSNPCQNGGTCVDSYNGYYCRCTSNWEGPNCETDVNECVVFIGTDLGCQNGATCINTHGSYRCDCPNNFYGVHCTEQHDDCSSASNEALCGHGTCVNVQRQTKGQPNFKCICDQGWTTGPTSPACDVDVNECEQSHPPCSQNPKVMCINLPGTFQCGRCPQGYTGNGYVCNDINECENNNGGCSLQPRVDCINTPGSRTCGPCPPGYLGDGRQCNYIGICNINNGGCHPLASCLSNIAISATYRECRCPPNYIGNGEGPNGCTPQIVHPGQVTSSPAGGLATACSSNPCAHGSCSVSASGGYYCVCFPGFTGPQCQTEIDECSSSPCKNSGTCIDKLNGFACTCPWRWRGPTCEEQVDRCGGRTSSTNGVFRYPYNGGTYPNNANCVWIINSTRGKVINITFTSFDLEYSRGCSVDFLQLNDGPSINSPLINRFCGSDIPESIVTSHHQLFIWFRTDGAKGGRGFQFTWNTTDPVCGGELSVSSHGTINSPRYPGNYPPLRDCYWLVQVQPGKRIHFSFATLQLEHHENCSLDYLQIFDGQLERDPVIGKYCGNFIPRPLETSGSKALVYFHSDAQGSDSGFHITYSTIPGILGCGGTLTSPSGTLSSPNHPDVYPHNLQCDWLIRTDPDETIQLKFTQFMLEHHSQCRFDFVEVYDGEDEESDLIGRYCGTRIPPVVMSTGNKMWIRFKTDYSLAGRGFRAEYNAVCGGTYTAFQGQLHTPNYPNSYEASKMCMYFIRLPKKNIIHLRFLDFDMESSSGCNYDHLQVFDGSNANATRLLKACGDNVPEPVTSSLNELFLMFTADISRQGRGFLANYTSEDTGCGGIHNEDQGQIASPSHPYVYPHNSQCVWLIRAPPGKVIQLTFDAFNLEMSASCEFDRVELYDDLYQRFGKFCGNRIPPVITTPGHELTIKFITDESVRREGFSAHYRFLDAATTCGGNFFAESGVIKTPRYPRIYPESRTCTWVLHAEDGHQFILNTTDFQLEDHPDCRYDYLEIRNGQFQTSPLVGRYCGNRAPGIITSHGNTLWLQFKSDWSNGGRGFQIHYDGTSTGCGGTVTSTQGSITSPNFPHPYGHNAECRWLIRVSKGSKVTLSFTDLDLEQHATCRYDFVEIFDGDSERAPSLGRFCHINQVLGGLSSTKETLFILFRTDYSGARNGFHLNYHLNCNVTIKGRHGVIESPNFPNPYPGSLNCSWSIQAPIGSNISFAFSHLTLESTYRNVDCRHDYVQFLQQNASANDEFTLLKKFCGSETPPPPPFVATSDIAIVNFVSDLRDHFDGFRLEWSAQGCGGHLTKRSGVIMSPNYPNGYPHRISCQWVIETEPGSGFDLVIEDVDLEFDANCRWDFLKVYSGEDDSSPPVYTACNRKTHESITVSSNTMFIHFYSDHSVNGRGFKARYYSLRGHGCGGYFYADSGRFHTKNYPNNYNLDDRCYWVIRVAKEHTVELTFEDFEVPGNQNCTNSYVAVYDGPSTYYSPHLVSHCGNTLPSPPLIVSTGNVMVVEFKAGDATGKGFSASYKSGCGARLDADNAGEIKSPGYPHIHPSLDLNCSYIIYSNDFENRITLTITHLLTFEQSETCEEHFVRVRDGESHDSPVLGTFCGSRVEHSVTSQGNVMLVEVTSLALFSATYSSSSSACGGTLTAIHGSFANPSYPNSYPLDTECVWVIKAARGNQIELTFSKFNLESSDYCNADYVEIREHDEAGPYLGRFCGTDLPANVTKTDQLWIKFRSDEVGTAEGFMAHYSLVNEINLSGSDGIIESPGYPHPYHGYENYRWRIVVPQGQFVSIIFERLSYMDTGYSDPCQKAIQIFNGPDNTAPLLLEKCDSTLPDPIVSDSNVVSLYYSVVAFFNGAVWRLHWEAVSDRPTVVAPGDRCGEDYFIDSYSTTLMIKSPGYPEGYAQNLNCTWTVSTREGRHIAFYIAHVDLEGLENECPHDYVRISKALHPPARDWQEVVTYCNRVSQRIHSLNSNLAKIEFVTDSSINQTGFYIASRSGCGGPLYGTSGVITSEHYGVGYGEQRCVWTIRVRPARTIQLRFEEFELPQSEGCNLMFMLVRNGGSETSPLLGKFCGTVIPTVPESSHNELYIQLYGIQRDEPYHFKISYQEVSASCGGQLSISENQQSVQISSPNYPNPPTHDVECDWTIISPPGTRLRLDFIGQFDLSSNCDQEFVHVRDGGTINARLIDSLCGSFHPNSQFSTSNAMFIRYVTAAAEPRNGFKAEIRTAECGGTYFVSHGYISSPNYPDNYENNQDCEWYLKTNENSVVVIIFEDFNLQFTSNCSIGDYLEVRDTNSSGILLGRHCGTTLNTSIIESLGNVLYLKFHSDGSRTQKGFKLRTYWRYSECGDHFNTPSGVIQSPNFPASFPYRRRCYWSISAPRGRIITLRFQDMNLRQRNGACVDKLQVMDRRGWPSAVLCGDTLPEEINSVGNTMRLIMVISNGLAAGEGFKAIYTTDKEAPCGGDLPSPSGVLQSPGFENGSYPFNMECFWSLQGSGFNNETTAFQFDVFELEGDPPHCQHDSLTIQGANTDNFIMPVHVLCGNKTGKGLTVALPSSLQVQFFSDRSISLRGFNATYMIHGCGGEIFNTEATITSPGYPSNYPQGVVCKWIIDTFYGQQIDLNIVDFNLEDDCTKDSLVIYNGGYFDSPKIGTFCGRNRPPTDIRSESSAMMIEFRSDSIGSAKGFKIQVSYISRGCGGHIHSNWGFLTSPGYPSRYPSNAECVWLLDMGMGYGVNMTFMGRFDIEMHEDCANDYIEIQAYDGATGWKNVSNRYCGRTTPDPLYLEYSKTRLTFRSNANNEGDGFKIQFTRACGGTYSSKEGTITSPGYPDAYANNLYCHYLLKSHGGKYLVVEFDGDVFELEGSQACEFDSITIYEGRTTDSPSHKYCGTDRPPSFTTANDMLIVFQTDSSVAKKGFSLSYRISECGGNFTSPTGSIEPLQHQDAYVNYMECIWTITVAKNRSVELKFQSMHVEYHYDCQYDYVEVRDGPNDSSPLIGRFCGFDIPPIMKTRSNQMFIRFITDHSETFRGFKGFYRTTYGELQGCGGTLNATVSPVTISSLDINGDGFYEPNLECAWQVIGADDQILEVWFEMFDVEQSPSNMSKCSYDFLQIRDGLSHTSPLVDVFCGNALPRNFSSASNRLYLHFHSDSQGRNRGFRLTVTSNTNICGGSLAVTDQIQTLESPAYPGSLPRQVRCTWQLHFNFNPMQHMQEGNLTFIDFDIPCASGYFEMSIFPFLYSKPQMCDSRYQLHQAFHRAITINYMMDYTPNARGFKLEYSKANACNKTYTSHHGFIMADQGKASPTYCEKTITVPEGFTISLYFTSFRISGAGMVPCEEGKLLVRDGRDASGQVVANLCDGSPPPMVFSTGNSVHISTFVAAQRFMSFSLDYISTDKGRGCGGNITFTRGVFTSPLYPEPYREEKSCYWYIAVFGENTLTLTFEEFELNSTIGCTSNFVEVFDGHEDSEENKISRYCGGDNPARYRSRGHSVLVKMVTDTNNFGSGFVASFVTNKIGRIHSVLMPDQGGSREEEDYYDDYY